MNVTWIEVDYADGHTHKLLSVAQLSNLLGDGSYRLESLEIDETDHTAVAKVRPRMIKEHALLPEVSVCKTCGRPL